jgi:hypothetical protein
VEIVTTYVINGDSLSITEVEVIRNPGIPAVGAIYYNSCAVGESLSSLGYRMINWRQL